MKNKGKKIVIAMMLMILPCAGIISTPPQEAYAMAVDEGGIMPMADGYVWNYKIQNVILYKRLFNASKKQGVGDWIRCK